jgi:phosphocarrier protein
MINKKVIVHEAHGLHARPAMKVVEKCQQYSSKVTICNGCDKADGCSMLELLMLAADEGTELEIMVSGTDEKDAVKAIADLFENGSGI